MKGICFKEPLFHAAIERRKTQTRQKITSKKLDQLDEYWQWRDDARAVLGAGGDSTSLYAKYKIGEILYLKEPYYMSENCPVLYKYDRLPEYNDIVSKWSNKLFMPAKYARYFIKITKIRCEWLQEISAKDCIAEGITKKRVPGRINEFYHERDSFYYENGLDTNRYETLQDAYAALIDEISGAGTWENDDWVWVYDFELLGKAEGE